MKQNIKILIASAILMVIVFVFSFEANAQRGSNYSVPRISSRSQTAQLLNIPDPTTTDTDTSGSGFFEGVFDFFSNLFTGGRETSDLTSADKNTDDCAAILANASQNRPDPKDKKAITRYARQQNLATMIYIDCVTANSNTSRVGSGLDAPNLPDLNNTNIDNLFQAPTSTPTSTIIIP